MGTRVDPSELLALQSDVDHIRNFCILAHVDHGKTTLSDSLVSSNGFISPRLAGKLRFLDSTEEEQKRGITMHSSTIALLYRLEEIGGEKQSSKEDFLINLVDSPGHIDFSSDVSTAARLCDGTLIVVDVLEGVCTQTHAVIYKALRERMKPCLVLNKIDRLIVESRLSCTEAYHHLRRLIENVNALAFTLVKSELLKQAMEDPAFTDFVLADDEPLVIEWTFAPEKGNVQFTSAIDGWGFGLMKFINLWSKKLSLNKGVLRQYLFEEYYLNPDTKKISKVNNIDISKLPMFAALVLEPIWELYDLALVQGDMTALIYTATEKHHITLPPREINPRDFRSTLQSIMRRWLPLADSMLRMVVRNMPSPKAAQAKRVATLTLPEIYPVVSSLKSSPNELVRQLQGVFQAISRCDSGLDAPLVVFVSKMVPVKVAELSKPDIAMLNQQRLDRIADGEEYRPLQPDEEVFLAIGRVFSGVLTRDSTLHVIGHKYDPFAAKASPDSLHTTSKVVQVLGGGDKIGCYVLLGPSVTPAESVPAGNLVGIVGLQDYILKTATVSSLPNCFPLKAITFQTKPMLKVAVEPLSHRELRNLEHGLQCLYQFDPVVEIQLEDNGQWTMTCLGELHLDQCVKALTEKFMK
jgi:ribosome assembly protein 1